MMRIKDILNHYNDLSNVLFLNCYLIYTFLLMEE